MSDQYPDHWNIIANCGYQGAQVDAQVIFLIKQPRSTNLSVYKNQFDINLSKDHASVENFLGCMKTMWGGMENAFVLQKMSMIHTWFGMLLWPTSSSVQTLICEKNGAFYENYLVRLCDINMEAKRQHNKQQVRYRRNQHIRLNLTFKK